MTVSRRAALAAALLLPGASAAAQGPGDSLTTAGVYRASALVDSVFIDRVLPGATVSPGDFGAYLLARLGVMPIPEDLRLRVAVDSAGVVLRGTIADLPLEARRELGPLLGMFSPETPLTGLIRLDKVAREVVRFRLAGITVNGVPLPEPFVARVMLDVGRRFPVLGRTGRDLFVEVPADAEVLLEPGRVRLIGPPAAPPLR
jgi:hypothetical protein